MRAIGELEPTVDRTYALLQLTWSHEPEVAAGYVSQQGRRW